VSKLKPNLFGLASCLGTKSTLFFLQPEYQIKESVRNDVAKETTGEFPNFEEDCFGRNSDSYEFSDHRLVYSGYIVFEDGIRTPLILGIAATCCDSPVTEYPKRVKCHGNRCRLYDFEEKKICVSCYGDAIPEEWPAHYTITKTEIEEVFPFVQRVYLGRGDNPWKIKVIFTELARRFISIKMGGNSIVLTRLSGSPKKFSAEVPFLMSCLEKTQVYVQGKKQKTVFFGQAGASDYTIHKDPERMKRYF
jgi:hypothetical protein